MTLQVLQHRTCKELSAEVRQLERGIPLGEAVAGNVSSAGLL